MYVYQSEGIAVRLYIYIHIYIYDIYSQIYPHAYLYISAIRVSNEALFNEIANICIYIHIYIIKYTYQVIWSTNTNSYALRAIEFMPSNDFLYGEM